MKRKRFWAFRSLGELLTLCAVVVGWEVSGAAIIGALTMPLDKWPLTLGCAVVVLLGLPVIFAGAAIFTYVRNRPGD